MFTTFDSFKKAGACSDGNKRFLAVIGNSSLNLPSLDFKMPVWVPLFMNPDDAEDIGWMFNPNLTYEHDPDDFEHLFSITRASVLKYGLTLFLYSVVNGHERYNDTYWPFATGEHKFNIASNRKKAQALVDLYVEAVKVLRDRVPQTNDALRAAYLNFERLCGTHIGAADRTVNMIVSPNPGDRIILSNTNLHDMFPLLRMAVMEQERGPVTASFLDQIYWTHFTLRNAVSLLAWRNGVHLKFKDKPGPGTVEKQTGTMRDTVGAPPKRRRMERSASFTARVEEYNQKKEEYLRLKEIEKTATDNAKSAADPLDTLTKLKDHPAFYRFSVIAVMDAETQAMIPETAYKESSELLFGDEDDDKPARRSVRRPTSDEQEFLAYDQDYVPTPRQKFNSAVSQKDEKLIKYVNGVAEQDEHGRLVLRSLSKKWTGSERRIVLMQWVYDNFDTNAFFAKLRVRGEQAAPPVIDMDWIMTQEKSVTATAFRTDAGELLAGVLTVRSPRLMLRIMQTIKEFEAEADVEERLTNSAKTASAVVIPAPAPAISEPSVPTPVVPVTSEIDRAVAHVVQSHSLEDLEAKAREADLSVKFGRGRVGVERKMNVLARTLLENNVLTLPPIEQFSEVAVAAATGYVNGVAH